MADDRPVHSIVLDTSARSKVANAGQPVGSSALTKCEHLGGRDGSFVGINVDGDNAGGACKPRCRDSIDAHAADADYCNVVARSHGGVVDDSTKPGGHCTPDNRAISNGTSSGITMHPAAGITASSAKDETQE
jgi:hypothetical protein